YGRHPDDFQFISTSPALTGTPINPGEVREVQMVFDPSSGGGRSARLEITTNDGDEPLLKVDLRGTGFEPEIDVSPLEIDFGYRSLAAGLSATRTVEIRNNGNRVLTLSGAGPVLVGPATAEFVLVNGGGGGVLNPGESRVVTLAFDPSQEGLRRARLQIASDDRDEPLIEVELYGRGTSQPAPIVVPPDQQPEPGHPRSPSNEIPSMIEEWNRYR
ncbi:MAG: choice-of-anchor D domain-containing protein, partial [Candidatus Omnitrophica bacterium]|nr:choice-of-anchor D domain-containing protein [Candidatus Omnitrophota bacterium]